MTDLAPGTGLYLPSSVIDSMAEERAMAATQRNVVEFFARNTFGILGLGHQPSHSKLLENVKGWPAIAGRAISDRFASVSPMVKVSRRTSDGTMQDEILDDHPLAMMLAKPNPTFSRRNLLKLAVYHRLWVGEAYWQIIRDGIGVPIELWPMPPQAVEPLGSQGMIVGYLVTSANGERTELPAEDVVRWWSPDPETLFTSMGHLGPQSTEYDTQRFMSEHLRGHFEKDATPRVALVGEPNASAPTGDTRDAFESEWQSRYNRRKGDSKGVPAFIAPGWKPHEFDVHGGAGQMVESDERLADQMLAAYGVPKAAVGIVTDVNRANAEAMDFVFSKNTILPLWEDFADAMTFQLAAQFDPMLFVAPEQIVSEDKDFRLKEEAQDLALKVRSPQQILRDRGSDIEDAPWGEFPVGTFGDVPYTGEEMDPGAESAGDLEPGAPREARRTAHQRDFSAESAWQRLLASERHFLKRLEARVARAFDAQRKDVLRRLREAEPRSRVEPSDLVDLRLWERILRDVVEPIRARVFTQAAEESAGLLGTEFRMTDEVLARIESDGARMIQNVNATTQERVRRILMAQTAEGASHDQIARALSTEFRRRSRARAIARTEILKANQGGQIESFEQSGVVPRKRWNTSLDAKVRDSHTINGQEADVGGTFVLNSGREARHPGDPALPASDVVNCRCFLTPVLEVEA